MNPLHRVGRHSSQELEEMYGQSQGERDYATQLQPLSPTAFYNSEVSGYSENKSSFPQSMRESFFEGDTEGDVEEQKLEFSTHLNQAEQGRNSAHPAQTDSSFHGNKSPSSNTFSKYLHPQQRNRYESEEDVAPTDVRNFYPDPEGKSDTFTLGQQSDHDVASEHEDQVIQVIPKPMNFPPRQLHAVVEPLAHHPDDDPAFSFRDGHGVLSRHTNIVNPQRNPSPVPEILSKPYNVLQLQECRQSQESTTQDPRPTPGSTPNFSETKDYSDVHIDVDNVPSEFAYEPIRRPSVRNVNDPNASPSKVNAAPRVRTGLDSTKKKGQLNISSHIPRNKIGELGDFAVLVEPDGGSYSVVGIQDLSGQQRKPPKRGYTPNAQKKTQNPRQSNVGGGRVKNAQHQPTLSSSSQNARLKSGVKNVQVDMSKREGPRTPHAKKPSVYDMPLKIDTQAAAGSKTPSTTQVKSNRSSGSKGGQRSEASFIQMDDDACDLGALKEMQEQLRKKFIEFSSELNSSFLKEVRNIQKPVPETVKILELFCGLVCVVQFASGVQDAWIKRPKSWPSIQAMLSSPAQVVECCRVFKDICDNDKYDISKVSALQCMLEKVQFRNITGPQTQPLYFLYSFAKCMANYVKIIECRKQASLQRQSLYENSQDDGIQSDTCDLNWMNEISTMQSQQSRRNKDSGDVVSRHMSMRDSDLLSEASCTSSQKYALKMSERRIHDQQQNKIDKFVKDTKKRIKERQSEVLFSAQNTPKPMLHKFQQGAARKPKINTNLNKSFVEAGTPSERGSDKPRPRTPAVNRTFCTRDNTPSAGRIMGGRKGSLGTVANKPKTILAGKQKPRATTPQNSSYSAKMATKKQPSIDNTYRKGTASRMWSSKTKEEKEIKTEPKPPRSLNTSFTKASSSNQFTPSGKKTPPAFHTPTHSRTSNIKKKHNFAFSNYGTQPQSSQDVPTPEPKPEREDLCTEEKTKEEKPELKAHGGVKRATIRRSFTKQEESLSFSRSKTPLKPQTQDEIGHAPRTLKRSNSQYIPPTKRLINMKNKKLRSQLEAAEKERNRQSLARIALNSSHLERAGLTSPSKTLMTSFTPESNNSMFSPSTSQAHRLDFYNTERVNNKTQGALSPIENKGGQLTQSSILTKSEVTPFPHYGGGYKENPAITAIKRHDSERSIQSSPPEKLRDSNVSLMLSPDQISQRLGSPEVFSKKWSPRMQQDESGEVVRRKMSVPSSAFGDKRERSSRDMQMIESLISRRKIQREEDLREKNLASKEKFINEAVGQDAIVQQEDENEKEEDSPTRNFLAGKTMKKKKSATQLEESENPSPGTWAEKQLRKDQKRIEKAMSMLQARK